VRLGSFLQLWIGREQCRMLRMQSGDVVRWQLVLGNLNPRALTGICGGTNRKDPSTPKWLSTF
jgi:hypothetical protein